MSAARFRETWRDAIRAIDRQPGESWRDQLFHHGFRVAVVLTIAAAVPLLFRSHTLPETVDVQQGAVATEDVIAAFEFEVPKSADQVARERENAERGVLAVYILDSAAADTAIENVSRFFEQADSVFGSDPARIDAAAARAFLRSNGLTVTDAQLTYLADPERRMALRRSIETAFRTLLPAGVAALLDPVGQAASVVTIRGETDRLVRRDSITTLNRFHEDALVYAPQDASVDGFQIYGSLLIRFRKPTLIPDDLATRTAREQARAAVDTVADVILEGERIVTAHERVGDRDLHRLGAYNAELVRRGLAGSTGRRLASAGSFLYTGILVALLAVVLLMFRPAIYRDVRAYLIVMGLVAVVMVSASLIQRAGYPSELIPVALLALLIGALYDGLIGFVAVAVVAGVVGGQIVLLGEAVFALAAVSVPFKMIAAGGAGALGIRRVRRRSHSWVLIALITG
ncbi:MAG: hypothetical protein KJO06_06120, partial [Gemmatimonadetes bacterium]|nr:hypothetical protein [Gemmatimonadota bacterium]